VGKGTAYRLLVEKPEGMKSLGRPRHRWLDKMNMDLGEVEWSGMDWIGLTQDKDKLRALVNVVNKDSGLI
jgi:hypothetical protein